MIEDISGNHRPDDSLIDTGVPSAARVYDALQGGQTNFAVDRAVATAALESFPGGQQAATHDIRAQRRFLAWAVRHLAEAGVTQFLDIGSGIPTGHDTHDIAEDVTPEARVVYVDKDPIVLAHAHELLPAPGAGGTTTTTAFLLGDLCAPEDMLTAAAHTLDLGHPVALILGAVLHFEHACDPHDAVRRLLDRLAGGSYMVITHLAADIQPDEMAQLAASTPPNAGYQFKMRTQGEVERFFDELEPLEPGVGSLDVWNTHHRIEGLDPLEHWSTPYHVGIGRKTAL